MIRAWKPSGHCQTTMISTTAAVALGVALCLHSGDARADESSADALFRDAKALMAQKRYTEACPKYAESQRLDPSGGTILHLALCHKEEGRIATAYKELQEAILFAQRDKREDREKAAKSLAAELLPKLPKLTITLSQAAAAVAGLEVKRDGAMMPSTSFGAPAAVDPGEHNVTAWAPGRKPFSTTVELRGDGATATLSIPDLEVDPSGQRPGGAVIGNGSSQPDPTGADKTSGAWSSPRKAGLVIGSVGLITMGVGSVFGLKAAAAKSDSGPHCNGNICDDEGVKLRDKGLAAATISTATFIAGGVATAGGLVLFLAGGSSSSSKKTAGVTALSVGPSWASVRGQF